MTDVLNLWYQNERSTRGSITPIQLTTNNTTQNLNIGLSGFCTHMILRAQSSLINLTGPSKPEVLTSQFLAVNKPSGPRFSARLEGKLTL